MSQETAARGGGAERASSSEALMTSTSTPKQAQSSWSAGINAATSGANASNPPLQSPCFVHSYLDTGLGSMRGKLPASYFDEHAAGPASSASADSSSQQQQRMPDEASSSTSYNKSRRQSMRQPMYRSVQGSVEPDSDDGESGSETCSSRSGSDYTLSDGGEEDENRVRSLTRQLAETAVGVREMSKQLGRARVKSTINSVLIITKARDNHLIKLTRELAIWLMATPRNGRDTGLVVYVDSQLRTSKRFDAEGIRRDYPQIFSSSNTSMNRSQSATDDASRSNGSTSKSSSSSTSHSSHSGGSPHGRSHDEGLLRYWTSDMCSRSPHLFDMVVTLGGDGTVLFCSWLFQRIVPPVMPFALGSLGFLTNFDFSDYKKVMTSALDTGVRVNLRMRFTATVYRATLPTNHTMDKRRRRAIRSGKTGEIIMKGIQDCGWDSIETPLPHREDLRGSATEQGDQEHDSSEERRPPEHRHPTKCRKDKEVMCFSTRPVETFEVINDLVVDRGPSPYVSLLEVFGDEHHLTTAQADGLCISTPTGSTAYSLSAGGSLVHPEIPAILISPICPHTLSFRPMLLPDSMELRIAVPYNSRSTAWASFDGRGRVELKQGDHIKVTASRYPFPTVCADNQSTDWFESISRTLKWNERQRQKSFVVVEEGNDDDGTREASAQKSKKSKEARQKAEPVKNAEKAGAQEFRDGEKSDQKPTDVDADEDDDEDDDDDDDDDEDKEEHYDIDDTSTVATRASSPDGTGRRRHSTTDLDGTPRQVASGGHHHHHHHGHGHEPRSAPSSAAGSTRNLFGLQPLTSAASNGKAKAANGERPTSSEGTNDSTHQHGIVSPAGRSVLDSPDRFGLAGPPRPPKAISERHLASADFRLDDGGSPTADADKNDAPAITNDKAGLASASKGRKQDETVQANALRDSITKMAEKEAQISDERRDNRLYHNLKKRSSSGRVPTRSGLTSTIEKTASTDGQATSGTSTTRRRNRSGSTRPSGAALVVYGQDESDSDSTAEG